MTIVLDASLALTWCFEDERRDDTVAIGRRILDEGAVVPGLFRLELANGMLVAERKGRISTLQVDEQLETITSMPIVVDPLPTDVAETRRLARTETLTVYDASYLELALRLGAELATLDGALVAAARRRGLTVLP